MKCPNCQTELKDTAKFCTECGTPILRAEAPAAEPVLESVTAAEPEPAPEPIEEPEPVLNAAPVAEQEPANKPVVALAESEPAPEATETPKKESEQQNPASVTDSRLLLTTAQYFWLTILFHIPVIGLIFLFVWGCGRPRNLSLKRYSLAILVMRLLCWLLYLVLTVLLLLGMNGMIPGVTVTFPGI